mmetsp:Transcript_49661/g.121242  ORF Transcript_49661/g.121242 Transcript_49661/m.121242 type:complete len:253 (-) Transcript_49661:1638-2396(-)
MLYHGLSAAAARTPPHTPPPPPGSLGCRGGIVLVLVPRTPRADGCVHCVDLVVVLVEQLRPPELEGGSEAVVGNCEGLSKLVEPVRLNVNGLGALVSPKAARAGASRHIVKYELLHGVGSAHLRETALDPCLGAVGHHTLLIRCDDSNQAGLERVAIHPALQRVLGLGQGVLNTLDGDVLSLCQLEDVLFSINDRHRPIAVPLTNVTGVHPSLLVDNGLRLALKLQVPLHDVDAPQAHLPSRHRLPSQLRIE